ncbi:Neurochondrin-domain-containing protein [Blyttiomyces helicus]|uniref:Neurochondrin-domain-containing protein n=1 Tax=Blyttiomyces helicus TaxID=388810 RepID=A0A4P9WKA2_9FUNG|nr:Neurochondrin-domain-containing protein [Blyttiomyces helicus]|eukprot:RKO92423.1 Neurochondrin-domain-containing protein [Blyttiomyces helicus]
MTEDPPHDSAPTSNPPPAIQQLDHCLELLERPSRDEEKFVALLILPRLLDPNDPAAVQRAFESMPWSFLRRLLGTDQGSADLPAETLHAIAANIIASFCAYESLAIRSELVALVPNLARLLRSGDESDLTATVLQCLTGMARSVAGVTAVLRAEDAVTSIAAIIGSSASTESDRIAAISLMRLLLLTAFDDTTTTLLDATCEAVLPGAAEAFAADQGRVKFESLQLSVEVLSAYKVSPEGLPLWAQKMRDGLKDVFANKLGRNRLRFGTISHPANFFPASRFITEMTQRDLSLTLASMLLRRFPARLIFTDIPDRKGKSRASRASAAQFGTLLIHIACAEIRVLLDDLPESNNPDLLDRSDHVLPICYEILEHAMGCLVDEEEKGEGIFAAEAVVSINGAFRETFLAVGEFLIGRWARYESTNDIAILDNIVTIFSLRALSSWLAEETTLPGKEVVKIVPLLVAAGGQRWGTFQCYFPFYQTLKSLDVHPMDFLTPALTALTAEELTRDAFISAGGPRALVAYLAELPADHELTISVIGVLLNVVVAAPPGVTDRDAAFREAVQILVRNFKPSDASTPRTQLTAILLANVTALSTFTLRCLSPSHIVALGPETLAAVLEIAAVFVTVARGWAREDPALWEMVSELWFLSAHGELEEAFVEPFADCIRQIPSLAALLDSSPGLIPLLDTINGIPPLLPFPPARNHQIIKHPPIILTDPESLAPDEKTSLHYLLTALVATTPRAKQILKTRVATLANALARIGWIDFVVAVRS